MDRTERQDWLFLVKRTFDQTPMPSGEPGQFLRAEEERWQHPRLNIRCGARPFGVSRSPREPDGSIGRNAEPAK